MRTKYVGPVHLPADLYQRLEQRGKAQERDPLQQLRWEVRQALTEQRSPPAPAGRLAAPPPGGTS